MTLQTNTMAMVPTGFDRAGVGDKRWVCRWRRAVGWLGAALLVMALTACGGGDDAGAGGGAGGTPSSGSGSNGNTGSGGTGGTGNNGGTGNSGAGNIGTPGVTKSAKRGVAYDLRSANDLGALAPGVSWWYNWGAQPNGTAASDTSTAYNMDYIPMLWNGNFDGNAIETYLRAHPKIKYLLLLNEPNLGDQSNLQPRDAAALWPRYEAVAQHTGVKLVGPAITWGNNGFNDPVAWLDAFYAEYRAANGNRDPQIDYIAFHWYDYGLSGQLDRLVKYGKPFWVTEFANWHVGDGSAAIDTPAKQMDQMREMVAVCEQRADVFRYAWFTGRWDNDTHFTSLLGADGQLTDLGKLYISLPF